MTKMLAIYGVLIATVFCVAGHGQARAHFDSDLLWRDTAGNLTIWLMAGTAKRGETQPILVDLAWQIRGTGDFDADGSGDILWRHTNGQVAIWFMRDGVRVGEGYPGGQDSSLSWTIQDVGDFDGDMHSDILWRDRNGQLAIWLGGDSNSAVYPGYGNTPAPVDLAWNIHGVGDFDADGNSDILWRHTSGQVAIWFMSGAARVGESYPGGQDASGAWAIDSVGDFDGDQQADILWHHVSGQLAIWFGGEPAGAAYPSYQNAGGPGSPSWHVQGVTDFDADGQADILWRDDTGQPAIWLMEGGLFRSDAYPPPLPNAWQFEGFLRSPSYPPLYPR